MDTFNKLLIDLYDNAQHAAPLPFIDYALGELKKVVVFDSCALADLSPTPDRRMEIRSLFLQSAPIERFYDRSRTMGDESLGRDGNLISQDTVLAQAFRQRGSSIAADVLAAYPSEQTLAYCRKYDTAHSLAFVSSKTFGPMLPALGLWRGHRRNAYTRQQARNATVLIPHLLQAREINRRLQQGGAAPAAAQAATALANRDGQLYFADSAVVALLQREWKQWTPPLLPRAMVEALRRSAQQVFVGKAIRVQAQERSGLLHLAIDLRHEDSGVLTAAEHRTALLAAQGLQYKEIARELGIAPATVRNQLHAAYRKLGVANKTALAAALAHQS